MRSEEIVAWVRSFKTGERWLNAILVRGGSKATEKIYARQLYLFCQMVGKNPDELIKERQEQLKSDNEFEKYAAEEQLQAVYLKIKSTGKIQTAKHVFMVVRSFYKYNRVPLRVTSPRIVVAPPKPINLEIFKKFYINTTPQYRTWVAILKDSGISREDAVELRYKDIKEEFEAGKQFITLYIVRRKEGVQYTTFLGPDAVEALKNWFEILRQKGVKITDNTPLISTYKGTPVSAHVLTTSIDRAAQKIGLKITPHRIRKMFATLMAMQGVHPVTLKHWMGHKIGADVEAHYIIPPVPEQRRLYEQAYPAISISEAVKIEKEKANLIEQLLMELGFDEKAARIVRKYNLTRSLSVGEIVGLLQQLRTE